MKINHIFLVVNIVFISNNVFADSWALPEEKVYESKNGQYKLTVQPRELSNQLNYFEDAVDGNENPGQAKGKRDKCIGILEKKTENSYKKKWEKELANDVSPVSALVSDNGKYVVTFDNWHHVGRGENVVVIYNQNGNLIKTYRLDEFISRTETIRLTNSVSSTWWGQDHELDEENDFLVLKLTIVPFPLTPWAPGRNLDEIREKADEYEKWAQNNKTIRRIRLSDGFIIDKPIIDRRFEYPKFECDKGQRIIQEASGCSIWQFCIIDNKKDDVRQKNIPDGKFQVSAFINGAWFKEVTGQYKNGKKHGTWIQVFNEGDTPCVREYNLNKIVKEECPQGWWGVDNFE